ncbi:unnamed protein product, partial [Diplocarpon coronariae]
LGTIKRTPDQRSASDTSRKGYVQSNSVQDSGTVRGSKVMFTADDFSVRAGYADGALMEKTIDMEKLVLALKFPIVKLIDGSSGGGSVTTIKSAGSSHIPRMSSSEHVAGQRNLGIPKSR